MTDPSYRGSWLSTCDISLDPLLMMRLSDPVRFLKSDGFVIKNSAAHIFYFVRVRKFQTQIGFSSYPPKNLPSFCPSLAVTLGQKPYFSEDKTNFPLYLSYIYHQCLKKDFFASECQSCIHSPIEMDVFDIHVLNI